MTNASSCSMRCNPIGTCIDVYYIYIIYLHSIFLKHSFTKIYITKTPDHHHLYNTVIFHGVLWPWLAIKKGYTFFNGSYSKWFSRIIPFTLIARLFPFGTHFQCCWCCCEPLMTYYVCWGSATTTAYQKQQHQQRQQAVELNNFYHFIYCTKRKYFKCNCFIKWFTHKFICRWLLLIFSSILACLNTIRRGWL